MKIIKDSLTPPGEFLSYMFLSGSLKVKVKVKVKHLGSECVDLKICVCKQFLVGLSRIMKHAVCILTRFPEFHMRTNFASRLYYSVCGGMYEKQHNIKKETVLLSRIPG
jgi:hypothetical protein